MKIPVGVDTVFLNPAAAIHSLVKNNPSQHQCQNAAQSEAEDQSIALL